MIVDRLNDTVQYIRTIVLRMAKLPKLRKATALSTYTVVNRGSCGPWSVEDLDDCQSCDLSTVYGMLVKPTPNIEQIPWQNERYWVSTCRSSLDWLLYTVLHCRG